MPLYELDCADCFAPCEVYRKNGKYCRPCALLRKLVAAANAAPRHRRCRVCQTQFAPLHVKDHLCAACAPSDAPVGQCAVCRQEAPLPYREVAVCLACVKGASPPRPERNEKETAADYEERCRKVATSTGRAAVVRALQAGGLKRRKENAGRERRALTLISNDDIAIPSP